MLRYAFAAAVLSFSAPSLATTIVTNDPAAFAGDTLHYFNWGDEGSGAAALPVPFTYGGLTFVNGGTAYNDAYGMPYLGGVTTITTRATEVGLYLASYYGPETISYSVNGFTGTLNVDHNPNSAFIGFLGLTGITTITISNLTTDNIPETDLTHFYSSIPSGVPEPSVWITMLLGFGVIGAIARRRAREPRVA